MDGLGIMQVGKDKTLHSVSFYFILYIFYKKNVCFLLYINLKKIIIIIIFLFYFILLFNIYIYNVFILIFIILLFLFLFLFINYFILKKSKIKKISVSTVFFASLTKISLASEIFSLWAPLLPPNFVSLITFSSELRFRRSWYRWKA